MIRRFHYPNSQEDKFWIKWKRAPTPKAKIFSWLKIRNHDSWRKICLQQRSEFSLGNYSTHTVLSYWYFYPHIEKDKKEQRPPGNNIQKLKSSISDYVHRINLQKWWDNASLLVKGHSITSCTTTPLQNSKWPSGGSKRLNRVWKGV